MEKTPSSQEKRKRLLPTFFCTYCQKFNLGIKLSGWSFVYIKEVDIKKALSVVEPSGSKTKSRDNSSRVPALNIHVSRMACMFLLKAAVSSNKGEDVVCTD